jgi:sporulation protein YlmC with PRC-barrel domain
VALEDSKLGLSHAAEDVRSRKVIDPDGQEIGSVEELLIDEQERRVRFLRVTSGGFLGLGTAKFLVPVEAIAKLRNDAVQVDQSADNIASAPRYDSNLVDDDYLQRLYEHYGYRPYWSAGYMYPRYPFYL